MLSWLKKLNLFTDLSEKTVFAESPEPNGVSKDYFFRMMSPQASKLAESFNVEETQAITNLLDEVKGVEKMNFVVIGAGTLWYLRESFHKVARYVEVDPLIDLYLSNQSKFLIEQFSKISLIRFQILIKLNCQTEIPYTLLFLTS
jgi:diphthamide synthase (EF-2-diphthine--ammonia ligase)